MTRSMNVPLKADITGCVLEIRITATGPGERWRWLLCAIADPFPRERHAAAWSSTCGTPSKAFEQAMLARTAVLEGYEP